MKSLRALIKALFLSKQRIKLWSVAGRYFFPDRVHLRFTSTAFKCHRVSKNPQGPGDQVTVETWLVTRHQVQGRVWCAVVSAWWGLWHGRLLKSRADSPPPSSPLCLSPPKGDLLTSWPRKAPLVLVSTPCHIPAVERERECVCVCVCVCVYVCVYLSEYAGRRIHSPLITNPFPSERSGLHSNAIQGRALISKTQSSRREREKRRGRQPKRAGENGHVCVRVPAMVSFTVQ